MTHPPFDEPVSEHVWRTRYRLTEGGHMQEPNIEASWDRVALAVSSAEAHHRDDWRRHFRDILQDFRFLPGGRILANAGTRRRAGLFNCFVAGPIEDSIHGIFNNLRESMATLQMGGGLGLDFSTLRPSGAKALASDAVASGPVSFMAVWDAASAALESHNLRRGAMMASLRCDHPDIETFIDAKRTQGVLQHFNLSVLLSDDFMRAVVDDADWPLLFPLAGHAAPPGAEVCLRPWSGSEQPVPCMVHRRLKARALWDRLLLAQHAASEPGVLFIDQINRANNLWYREQLWATNPCGQAPLPPHGACALGSINLTRFVRQPFNAHSDIDFSALKAVAGIATRLLDDVHDISPFPLKVQEKEAHATRRIGLGVTGLADMFAMLGLRYGSDSSHELAQSVMQCIRDAAVQTSVAIAREKGAFPECDKTRFGASPFVLSLSHELQDAIAQHGMRNSHLLSVAPAGSISLLAGNVSSGIEPVFAYRAQRQLRGVDGQPQRFEVRDDAWRRYQALHGPQVLAPEHFRQAADIGVQEQLRMVASVQSCVDNAVSKTVRLPADATAPDIGQALRLAWELGLKGCALHREGSMAGA